MATIRDVALEAQVAASTVWRVVNDPASVKEETRERVEHAMRRVDYRPRKTASRKRALRIAFIYTLDTLIKDALGAYCRQIAAGIQAEAERHGMTISLFRGAERAEDDPIIHELLSRRPFDGVILLGPGPRDGYMERLVKTGMPLVVFNRPVEEGTHSCVTCDYFGGMVQTAEHLVGLGHRQIAIAHNPAVASRWLTRERLRGLNQVLANHGLEPILIEADTLSALATGGKAVTEVTSFCQKVLEAGATAVIAADAFAVLCADQFEQWGNRVPEDVSVMGLDNLDLRTGRGQLLTASGSDRTFMGRLSVRVLRHMARPGSRVIQWRHSAVVPTQLVEGQTTASPPNGAATGAEPVRSVRPSRKRSVQAGS